jgi:uncharacterized protein (DUF2062 family)
MVFKRRNAPSILTRVREFFYPRKGWRRAFQYLVHKMKRLPDTPHKIALGLSCGIFVSFSPFFGFHFIYAALCAWMIRANILASLIGTFFGNPLTFPFIAAMSLNFGRYIMGINAVDEGSVKAAFVDAFSGMWQTFISWFGYGPSAWDLILEFFRDIFVPYYVGGILPGVIAAAIAYFLLRPLVAAYQLRRRRKQAARMAANIAPSAAE